MDIAKCQPSMSLLRKYYREVLSLKEFLQRSLAPESQHRLTDFLETHPELASYAANTFVGTDITLEGSVTLPDSWPVASQAEVVASVISNLLRSSKRDAKNILTLGYTMNSLRNTVSFVSLYGDQLVNEFPNSQVAHIKCELWQSLLELLGEDFMVNMLCTISLFASLDRGTLYQISGEPLSTKKILIANSKKRTQPPENSMSPHSKRLCFGKRKIRNNHEIALVRSRVFYCRPALSSRGTISFGLRHVHLLNRVSNLEKSTRIEQLLRNVFPLQFGLHNVFSSFVDRRETVQPFKDYTFRKDTGQSHRRIPKQLPQALGLCLDQLHRRHRRLAYGELLNYYCPDAQNRSSDSSTGNQSSKGSIPFHTQGSLKLSSLRSGKSQPSRAVQQQRDEIFTNYASDVVAVESFLRAVLIEVIPNTLLGTRNIQQMLSNLCTSLSRRRYETITLQELMSGLKIVEVPWMIHHTRKLSLSETRKKEELLAELVYWLADSLVMPILSCHFYITESHLFRNRVMYFRHDTWRALTEVELAKLKLFTLSQVDLEVAQYTLQNRQLSFAYLRLLPKGVGTRPITNLKRRGMTKDGKSQTGQKYLLPSINSVLHGIYTVLNYECELKPSRLGFAIGSIDGLHKRLKALQNHLKETNYNDKLYFAKADVKSCFDTIDQEKAIAIATSVLSEDEYLLQKYTVLAQSLERVTRKFRTRAIPAHEYEDFRVFASNFARKKGNAVLVDGVLGTFRERESLLNLLRDHLTMHLIKIGKKFYRQDVGIPQGSILSTILCNLYYADLEAKTLDFVKGKHTMCVRLIDDFLCVSTDKDIVSRFLQVMHDGNAEYGCFVSSSKSLANFDIVAGGERIPVSTKGAEFPYCGLTIHTTTLNVHRDYTRSLQLVVSDTVTIDYTNTPGTNVLLKLFQGVKLSCQTIFVDTNLNNLHTVLVNVYHSLIFCAMRYVVYLKEIKATDTGLKARSFGMIQDLSRLLFVHLRGRGRADKSVDCAVTFLQIDWLAKHAFKRILETRSRGYESSIKQLSRALKDYQTTSRIMELLTKVARSKRLECFEDFQY